MIMPCIWFLLAASWILWLFIYFRVRFFERTFPSLDSDTPTEDPDSGWPFISILVPARNEEQDVTASLAALMRQDYPHFEIIFVDADIILHPSAVRKAMAVAREFHVDALSILPSLDCHSFWEKCVMPLFATLSVLVEPMDRANHPEKRGSRLAGAFLLIRRTAYEHVGGHRAIGDRIIEDMALAHNLKVHGHAIWLAYTKDLARTRMYDSFHDLWKGLSRLSFPMLRYSVVLLLAAYAAAIVGTLVPWLVLVFGFVSFALGHAGGLPLAILGGLLCLFSRHALRRIFSVVKIPSHHAWLLPLAASLYCLAATYAAFCHFTGKGIGWKQRMYHHA